MNISGNYSNFAFQARIKINRSNVQLIKNAALGTTATVAGAASLAAGADSSCVIVEKAPTVYGSVFSPETIDAVRNDFLLSHEPEGLPGQAVTVPSALSSYGTYNIQKGAEYWDKKIPD